jgi:hypothetical protein
MKQAIDHATLHRTAKYFMDSGRAASHEAAMALLEGFGLTIHVGDDLAHSVHQQTALLTLINVARRTFLGGIEIIGFQDCLSITPLAPRQRLAQAVQELGGTVTHRRRKAWPAALIGDVVTDDVGAPCWRLTWEGWRGGVTPARAGQRLAENRAMALAPVLAAAACASEAFSHHAADHPMAGRRAAGLSLWKPGANWLAEAAIEPDLAYLPSRLWIIGLGNLGQAFSWLLGCLPYQDASKTEIVLQDYDRLARSNISTSMLSFEKNIGQRKARVVGEWLDARGFETFLLERPFGSKTVRSDDDPNVALCGVDNAKARAALEYPKFGLVVEAGLGAGPQSFRSVAMHTFPGTRRAEDIWSRQVGEATESFEQMAAYQELKRSGMDDCGLAQLASRTVGVPFVGLIAGSLVIGELLRRLHGGRALEFAAGSISTLEDFESGSLTAETYAYGHVPASEMRGKAPHGVRRTLKKNGLSPKFGGRSGGI